MLSSLDYVARGLQALRKERGISQAALAEAAGISTKLVSAIEQRDRSPSLDTLDRLCIALGVSPVELFEAGRPSPTEGGRGISDRAASIFHGLSEDESERMLEVIRSVRELVTTRDERAAKPKARRRYGVTRPK